MQVKLRLGGVLYVPESELKKKIKINVKTFFGSRKKFSFEIDISSTVQALKNLIIDSSGENAKSFYNLRLIYPMGIMLELNVAN